MRGPGEEQGTGSRSEVRLNPSADLVPRGGWVLVRAAGRLTRVDAPEALVEALVRTPGPAPARLAAAVAAGHPQAAAEAAYRALVAAHLLLEPPGAGPGRPLAVGVLGQGPLARAIGAELARRRGRFTVVGAPEAEVLVWAEEGVAQAAALAVNDACLADGRPVLFVLADGDGVTLWPLVVPGLTPCLACRAHATLPPGADPEAWGALPAGRCPEALLGPVAEGVAAALDQAATVGGPPAAAFTHAERHRAHGGVDRHPLASRDGCAACARAVPRPGVLGLGAALALDRRRPQGAAPTPTGPPRRRVAIVGGGTAGYLTALALAAHRPDLAPTVIESPEVPVIGVGEATTPALVDFLHRYLGIDPLAFHRAVRPTWKLGIRFLWGPPGEGWFHHPFAGERVHEAFAYGGDQDDQSLAARLMARDLAPVLRDEDGTVVPLLDTVPHAYHLDNARLVGFLRARLEAAGVPRRLRHVTGVAVGPEGRVTHLETREGERLAFDYYVDATGFRARLLGEALGVPFRTYAEALVNDAAVVADAPHGGDPRPYTTAETLDAGWCWHIPTTDADHLGYVFSSAFLTPEAAEAELRARHPAVGEARLVRFRSGRREACWAGNVFAVGNAYAFVEPLESTALHMLTFHVTRLVETLPAEGDDPGARAALNAEAGRLWDRLRDFLAIHFRFNRRRDTAYWRACRETTPLGGAEALVAAYQAGAPLAARPDRRLFEGSAAEARFFGLLGFDNLLHGQEVPARILPPGGDRGSFERWRGPGVAAILARALPQREALGAYLSWLEARG